MASKDTPCMETLMPSYERTLRKFSYEKMLIFYVIDIPKNGMVIYRVPVEAV